MTSFPITMVFGDGETLRVDCRSFETVVQAAARHGVRLLTECREGGCGTCKASLQAGSFSLDDFSPEALPDAELAEGRILACRLRPESPCVIEFDYPLSAARRGGPATPRPAIVTEVRRIAADVVEVGVEAQDGKPFQFIPGQYASVQIAGTSVARSYSFASLPGSDRATFLVRLVRDGAMSTWLQSEAAPGARLMLSGPFGRFFLRDPARPLVLVAGGSGLGPIVSMLDALRKAGAAPPSVKLAFGVNTSPALFYRERLQQLIAGFPNGKLVMAVMSPDAGWDGLGGTAVDALDALEIGAQDHAYLCGPPAMVEGAQAALARRGLSPRSVFTESFLPSTESKAA